MADNMKDKQIDKRLLKDIRRRLAPGSYKQIARELNFSLRYVSSVLEGSKSNNHVVAKAIELMHEQESKMAETMAELNM
jgi:hypothetical protein